MGLVGDLLDELAGSVAQFHLRETSTLWRYVVMGALVAAGGWVACSYYTRLWNLRYRLSRGHQYACGVVALVTFGFALLYPSLSALNEHAKGTIAAWRQVLVGDAAWTHQVLLREYAAAKEVAPATKLSDDQQVLTFVGDNEASQLAAAMVVAKEVARDFEVKHPFLGRVLATATEVPQSTLHDDMKAQWTNQPGSRYPIERGIGLVAAQLSEQLDRQTPRVVWVARAVILTIFIFVQLLVFGIVGIAAYRDLKHVT